MGYAQRKAQQVGMIVGLTIWVFSGIVFLLMGASIIYAGSWAGAFLILIGTAFMGIALRRYRLWSADLKEDAQVPEISAVANEEEILFHWNLPEEAWSRYVQMAFREYAKTVLNLLAVVLMISLIFWFSISNVMLMRIIVGILWVIISLSVFAGILKGRRLSRGKPEVIIKKSGLILGGQVILYRDEYRWPREVVVLEGTDPPVMRVIFEKYRSSRYTFGKSRTTVVSPLLVPVPRDKLNEALLVRELILQQKK